MDINTSLIQTFQQVDIDLNTAARKAGFYVNAVVVGKGGCN